MTLIFFRSTPSLKLIGSAAIMAATLIWNSAQPAQAAGNAIAKLSAAPAAAGDSFRHDLDHARASVYPALVNIAVVARYFQGGRAQRSPAAGSGVIISPDGYVLTNFHVAGHTTRITCTTSDGVSYRADVVGHDPLADISVLKLEVPKGGGPLAYAKLGNSDKMQVGDFVLAMGNPLLLSSSMTLGIVSNSKRVFTDFTGTQIEDQNLETGERTGTFTRWIQHDALILPGNSGGPLVNLKGEVIGINELGGDGVGFAIPSNIARQVFEQVIKYGEVRRGWLGVDILPVQKLGRTSGALVSSVAPNSPADKAGIQPGSIITSIDGKPVNVVFFEQVPLFYQQIAAHAQGEKMAVTLLYDSKSETKTATLNWMDPYLGDEEDFPAAGLTVRGITPAMAQEEYLPGTSGVEVTGVRAGYPFETAQPNIEEGDIITSLNGHAISDEDSFKNILVAATKSSQPGDKALVEYRRDSEQMVTTVTLNHPQTDSGGGELPHAWLGIKTQVVEPDIAAALGNSDLKGFRVTEVYPYTEANKAGLKVGDIITKLNDSVMDASRPQDSDDLHQAVEALDVGDTAQLTVMRGGGSIIIPVKLEASPESAAEAKSLSQKELEFSVRDINAIDRYEHHWSPSQTGVLVTETTMGGYANIAGLRADDLIASIDGTSITKVDDIKATMSNALKTKPHSIEIFVRRQASTQFVFIEPDWSKITVLTESQD